VATISMQVVPASTSLSRPVAGKWNTLRILKVSRGALLALDLLLLLAVVLGARVHRSAMQTVGKDAAPSIIAAQHIKSALADMDANAANELLGPSGTMQEAISAYEARRVEASKALIAAAENITYGESERKPILALQLGLGSYERLIQKARDGHDSGGSGAAVAAYRDAAALMDGVLLPAADALDQANHQVLEMTYQSQSSRSFAARAFVLIAGAFELLGLAAVQVMLSNRMHRTVNPALLGATLFTLILTVYAWQAMERERYHLRVAKEDAFTSIHALWRARAVAYQANGDESRLLLDPPNSKGHEDAFMAKSASLASLPTDRSREQVIATLRRGAHVNGFTGYLADELNNITFDGERAAAIQSLVTWESYLDIDAKIRSLQRQGQTRQAVELCLGNAQGQSNWAFDQFDRALLATLDINQKAFDASVDKGLSAIGSLEIKALAVAIVIALLCFAGMAPRIREYA
jgi:hypothetical protein